MNKCNKCGHKFDGEVPCLTSISMAMSYGSMYDGQSWGMRLCDECLTDIVKTFKVIPDGFFKDIHPPYLTDRQRQSEFALWRRFGKWDNMRYATYDELVSWKGFYTDEVLNNYITKLFPDKPLLKSDE